MIESSRPAAARAGRRASLGMLHSTLYCMGAMKENRGDGISGGHGGDMRVRGDWGFDGDNADGFFGALVEARTIEEETSKTTTL